MKSQTAPTARRGRRALLTVAAVAVTAGLLFCAIWWVLSNLFFGASDTQRGRVDLRQTANGPAAGRIAAGSSAWKLRPELAPLVEEALEVARRLARDYPDSPDALYLVGLLHQRYGADKEAVRRWQQCLSLDPDYPHVYLCLGERALRRGNYREAVRRMETALELAPDMPGVRLPLANALTGMGKIRQAAAVLEEHVRRSPGSVEGFFRLGQVYMHLGQYEQAKQCHQEALRLNPDCRQAYFGLAMACDRLGQKQQAEQYRREFAAREDEHRFPAEGRRHPRDDLVELRKSVATAYLAAGKVYAAHGNAHQAETHWRKAVEAYPETIEARMTLVSFYERQGRIEEAIQMLDQVREIEPDNPLHCLKLGMLNIVLKRVDAAEAAFRKATELAPESPDAYIALAQLYIHGGRDPSRAKEAAQTAVRLQPSAANYFLLATVCDRCGDVPGALTAIKRALELDPDNPLYRDAYVEIQAKRQTPDHSGM